MNIIKKSSKIILCVALILSLLLSVTFLREKSTNPETYSKVIEVLDEKKMNAMTLTSGIVLASTIISAVPGDSTSAVADQLTDLTNLLVIVVGLIYFEKFLLMVIGHVSFGALIPIACVLGLFGIISHKEKIILLAIKIAISGLLFINMIPFSTTVMSLMDDSYHQSVENAFSYLEEIEEEEEENKSNTESNWFSSIIDNVTDTVKNIGHTAENILSIFVDAVAVMLITTCAIPIAVVVCTAWLIKFLFGIDVHLTMPKLIKSKKID